MANGEEFQGAGWAYKSDLGASQSTEGPDAQKAAEPISWTGSEFIAKPKGASWYFALGAIVTVISAIVYITVGDVVTIVTLILAGILFAIIAGRAPRQRSFMIDDRGVTVDSKLFPYHDFKSFNVLRDGAIGYIDLRPLRRFMPELSLYYAPEDEQKIFNVLATHLPNEQEGERKVDRLMRKLKF